MRKWRKREEMEKEGGNGERIGECRESISRHFLLISSFSLHFLFISSFSLHFLAARPQGCNDSCSPGSHKRVSFAASTASTFSGSRICLCDPKADGGSLVNTEHGSSQFCALKRLRQRKTKAPPKNQTTTPKNQTTPPKNRTTPSPI